jgi:hypothetical protein
MILSFTELLTSLLLLLVAIATFTAIGWILFKILRKPVPASLQGFSWAIFFGVLFSVSLYAVVRTGFRTMLLPVPVLVIAGIYYLDNGFIERMQTTATKYIDRRMFFIFILLVAFCWMLNVLPYLSFHEGILRYAGGDPGFYARASEFLNWFGKESPNIDYVNPEKLGIAPYHYGDVWLNALLSRTGIINETVTLTLVSYPLMEVVFSLGTFCFLLQSGILAKLNSVVVLITGSVFLVSGLKIFFPGFLVHSDVLSISPYYYPKTLIPASGLVFLLTMITGKQWRPFFIITLVIGICFINVAPSLFAGAALFALYVLINRQMKINNFLPVVLLALFSVFLIIFIYKFFPGVNNNSEPGLTSTHLAYSIGDLKTSMHIFVGGLFQFFVLIPFAAILILFRKKLVSDIKSANRFSIIYACLIPLTGLVSWAILYKTVADGVQFFSNVFIPVCSIFAVGASAYVLSRATVTWQKLLVGLLVLFACVQNISQYYGYFHEFDKREFNAVRRFVGEKPGYFVNYNSSIASNDLFQKNTVGFPPLPVLQYFVDPYVNISLNSPFLMNSSDTLLQQWEKPMLQSAPYSYYYFHHNNKPDSVILHNFIKEKNIAFLTVPFGITMPVDLQDIVKDSLVLSKEQWKIYKF